MAYYRVSPQRVKVFCRWFLLAIVSIGLAGTNLAVFPLLYHEVEWIKRWIPWQFFMGLWLAECALCLTAIVMTFWHCPQSFSDSFWPIEKPGASSSNKNGPAA